MNNSNQSIKALEEKIRKDFKPLSLSQMLQLESPELVNLFFSKMDHFVSANVRGISSSQLRKVYDKIVGARQTDKITIQRPQFAYIIARQPNESAKKVMLLVELLAREVSHDTIKGFLFVLESIVALHKFYETLRGRRAKPEKILEAVRKELAPFKLESLLELEKSSQIDKLLQKVEDFIKENGSGVTSTQLRNIYDKVLAANTVLEIKKLYPVLAYTLVRQGRDNADELVILIIEATRLCENADDSVVAFSKFMEIIVCYHKYYESNKEEGQDSKKDKHSSRNKKSSKYLLEEIREHFKPFSLDFLLTTKSNPGYAQLQDKLKEFIYDNADGVNSSQLRKLYDSVKDSESIQKIKLLHPLFYYTIARQGNLKAKKLMLLLSKLTKEVNKENLKGYKQLMENVVSYHKYFEVLLMNYVKINPYEITR